jgi:hypothetical protein
MFKSKHSGWTWELKRTPFGGGGGGWNPVAAITNPISAVLGTDGSGGGALGALASVDPGPAIGQGLASVDQAVNQIPGGWITVGALAAGGAALAYAPEVMALAAAEGITPEAAAIATGTAPIDIATGATVPLETLATDVGVSSGTGLTGGAGGSTGLLSGGTTSGLTIPTGAGIAVDPAIAAASGAGIGGTGAAIGGGLGTVGELSAGLPAAGSVGGGGAGLSAELAPGTILGTGALGAGEIGASYTAGANGLPATDFFGNYIPASSTGIGGSSTTGTSLSDALRTANQARQVTSTANTLSKLLSQGAGSGLSRSLGQLAQGTNAQGQELTPLVRGNTNPFVQMAQQPIQNAKPMDLSSLANLLKQG